MTTQRMLNILSMLKSFQVHGYNPDSRDSYDKDWLRDSIHDLEQVIINHAEPTGFCNAGKWHWTDYYVVFSIIFTTSVFGLLVGTIVYRIS